MVTTDYLVLKATAYGENALILSGISPEQGRLDFIEYGARRGGRKGVSAFGLFRHLRVSYEPSTRDMQRSESVEVIADYGSVSQVYEHFLCGCWLGQFALGNVMPGMASEYVFKALDVAFERLSHLPSGEISLDGVRCGVMMVYMQENGLMPPFEDGDNQSPAQCQYLIDMGLGGDVPRLTAENWIGIRQWIETQLRLQECVMPV